MSGAVIILLIVVIFTALGLLAVVISAVEGNRHYFVCRNCGQIFQPKWIQMCFNVHVFDEHMLKCPYCKVKDFCGDKGKHFKKD